MEQEMLPNVVAYEKTLSKPRAEFRLWDEEEKPPKFGSKEMRSEFLLNFNDVKAFCNQGSYGVCPKRVIDYKCDLIREAESYPDEWFRVNVRGKYDEALNKVAGFLGADPDNLVFTANVTTSLNTVLKGLCLDPESEVLHTSHVYLSTKFTIHELIGSYDADALSVDLKLPVKSEDDIVDFFEGICQRNTSIRVMVIDHISSCSGIMFPVGKIARAVKKYDKLVVVDGAHAPGQANLNLEELGECGVDFYAGNLHKWCLAPRGCGILWSHPKHHDKLKPLVTANLHKLSFKDQFFYQGTCDQSNQIAAGAAVDFYNAVGGVQAAQEYVGPLLDWAQNMIAEALGTEKLAVPKSMEAPFMRCVAMPKRPELKPDIPTVDRVLVEIMKDSGVVVQIAAFNERIWARLSGSMFSRKEDYVRVKDALIKRFILD